MAAQIWGSSARFHARSSAVNNISMRDARCPPAFCKQALLGICSWGVEGLWGWGVEVFRAWGVKVINNKILFRCRHTYTYTCIHIHIYTYVFKCCCKIIFVSVSKARSTYYKNNCPIMVCLELCFFNISGRSTWVKKKRFWMHLGWLLERFWVILVWKRNQIPTEGVEAGGLEK